MSQPARRPRSAALTTPTAMPAFAPVDKPDESLEMDAVVGVDVAGLAVANVEVVSEEVIAEVLVAEERVPLDVVVAVLPDALMLK